MLSKRDAYVDVLRGIAIICVAFGHAIQKCNCMIPTDSVQSIIATFQMALFFAISGYVSCYSDAEPLMVLKRRVFRLLVPYLSWVILLCAVQSKWGDLPHLILNSQFWFLRVLFLVSIVVTVSVAIGRKLLNANKKSFLVGTGVLVAILGCGVEYALGQRALTHYLVCYVMGILAFYLTRRQREWPFRIMLKSSVVIFALQCICWRYIPSGMVSAWRHLMALSGSLSMCYCSCLICDSLAERNVLTRTLSLLGRESLSIYAVHWNVFFLLFPLPLVVQVENRFLFYVSSILVCIVWLLASVGAAYVLRKVPMLSELFLGERHAVGVKDAGRRRA